MDFPAFTFKGVSNHTPRQLKSLQVKVNKWQRGLAQAIVRKNAKIKKAA